MVGFARPFILWLRLRGPGPDELRRLAKQVEQIMFKDPEVEDISTDWRQRVPLIRPVVAETQARNAGLTRSDIASGIQYATEGRNIGYYREKDELLSIIASSPEAERTDVADLTNAQIYSPVAQGFIPLQQVLVNFETVSENQIIRRRNRLPTLTIRCNAKDVPTSENLAKTEISLTHVLERCRGINLVQLEPSILLNSGRWYYVKRDVQQAHQQVEEALDIADRCEYRLKQADIHNFLAEMAFAEGDKETARKHAEIAKERAWCDGPPHCYKKALDQAEQMLAKLK